MVVHRTDSEIYPNGLKILLISPPLLNEKTDNGPFEFARGKCEESKKLAGYYRQIAEKYDVDYLDAAPYTHASEIDCIHIDEQSHLALAAAVAEKIKEMYK